MSTPRIPRIALFHDCFAQRGGAERVAEALHRILPSSDLFTTMTVPHRLSEYMRQQRIRTTWMQALPAKARLFRHYFLLYPLAIESVQLKGYDLIVSSCFGYAKGIRRAANAVHVCYCHTPMRWVWRRDDYLQREPMSNLKRRILAWLLKPLKAWEIRAAKRPDLYIANSQVVATRLFDAFGIHAEVIHPPINTSRFTISNEVDDYYLVIGRLTPYKRNDLAIQACNALGRKLIVIGEGPDRGRLESISGPNITFIGRQPDDVVARYAARCRALLFPGEEDFGMVPLEVNAAGRPVIAFHGGGAVETVLEGTSGLFFYKPTVESLVQSIRRSESMHWNSSVVRQHAEKFDTHIFEANMLQVLERVCPAFSSVAGATRRNDTTTQQPSVLTAS